MQLFQRLQRGLLRYRLAFTLVATLLLFIVVTLPFSLVSVVDDLLGSPDSSVYPVPLADRPVAPAAVQTHLHLALVSIDELQRLITIRVSGNRLCDDNDCGPDEQLTFFSLAADAHLTEGQPPSVVLPLPRQPGPLSTTLQLPIEGVAVRYPFDAYTMELALRYQRRAPDGRWGEIGAAEAAARLFLTLQEKLPRLRMEEPRWEEPARPSGPGSEGQYLVVMKLHLVRPLYLQVLTVVLVLLVSAAAAYAVFMRPLNELVINCGALVLGVWGIRAIIVPTSQNYLTSVELSLACVILFLLLAITVRALRFIHDRAGLHLLPASPPPAASAVAAASAPPPSARGKRRRLLATRRTHVRR
jgi:hypothetical protein